MSQGQPDLGEQALSKLAEIGISSQLDEVEDIDVDIRTDPLRAVQGEVDAVALKGKGMVMKQDLRVETVEIVTGNVSVNPLSTLLGKIELTQPTNADARLVLTEADINRALASDYLQTKMQNTSLEANGQSIRINTSQTHVQLLQDGRLSANAELHLIELGETKQISITALPELQDNGDRIALKDIQFSQQGGISLEMAIAIAEEIMKLLNLRNFELPNMSLQFKELRVEQGKLILQANAQVRQFPATD